MLHEIWKFLKHPDYKVDENLNIKYRLDLTLKLLGISLVISLVLGFLIGAVESLAEIDLGRHAMDVLFEQYSAIFILIAGVVLAPLLEEFFFRGPMIFFKKQAYFRYVFYMLTLAFGFYHLTNFEITPTILVLSPLLVAPQLCVGALLGFLRVRFGLLWAIGLHAAYNFVLIGPVVLLEVLNIPWE
ncbi:MAG TPA: CPBP family intramembrane glutamic endopeptidase [Eudoraea sp.]|nr:CPBP family intramembrane glutamic endopeptidase [Eudoraea sp.]